MVPLELIQRISLLAPVEVTLNLAQTNSDIETIINDDKFWEEKFHHDYPDIKIKKESQWRSFYLDYSKNLIKAIPIYVADPVTIPYYYADFWVRKTSNILAVYTAIKELLTPRLQAHAVSIEFVADISQPEYMADTGNILASHQYHRQSMKFPLTMELNGNYSRYIFWTDVKGILVILSESN